jgi:hypothetical protein
MLISVQRPVIGIASKWFDETSDHYGCNGTSLRLLCNFPRPVPACLPAAFPHDAGPLQVSVGDGRLAPRLVSRASRPTASVLRLTQTTGRARTQQQKDNFTEKAEQESRLLLRLLGVSSLLRKGSHWTLLVSPSSKSRNSLVGTCQMGFHEKRNKDVPDSWAR